MRTSLVFFAILLVRKDVIAVVKSIRRLCLGFFVLSVVGIIVMAMFIAMSMTEAAVACGTISVAAMILLYRQSRQLFWARLICDNPILIVPSSIVTVNCDSRKMKGETVVSTFGMLLGDKLYKWGCDGVHGTRLQEIRIDREQIWLTFGTPDKILRLKLLHGMTSKETISKMAQKLMYETGVQAEVCDW